MSNTIATGRVTGIEDGLVHCVLHVKATDEYLDTESPASAFESYVVGDEYAVREKAGGGIEVVRLQSKPVPEATVARIREELADRWPGL